MSDDILDRLRECDRANADGVGAYARDLVRDAIAAIEQLRKDRDAAHAHACEASLEERDVRAAIEQRDERLRVRDKALHYIAFTLTGDEEADPQLSADRAMCTQGDLQAAIEQRDAEIARLREQYHDMPTRQEMVAIVAERDRLRDWQDVARELHNALVGEGRAGAIDWDRIERAFARIDVLDAALAAQREET